jgi:hypothetical protein
LNDLAAAISRFFRRHSSAPLVAGAQRDGKVYKIGLLRASRVPEAVLADALRFGLRERGWIENENFTFVKRNSTRRTGSTLL